ncbi:MAG TPA: hypothetical protein VOB72_21480 [Candidatus Dormibacteraeota bacterium]|nr:hypothetical protein [Candidatus Dormibacteraeota bacterium]
MAREAGGGPPGRDAAAGAAFEGSTWRALATRHDPRFAPNTSGTEPVGNRLYLWPESLYVDRITTPTVSWSKNGMPLPLPPTGVMELPIYFWFAEEYGKEPWTPDSTSLLPPPIGGDRFAFDGEDGAEYRLFDLEPIQ